ncbi:hypothetical protein RDI58_019006 [Solanum bulbocastanum]|uniref:Uncharacterized protein n=1 Tax=Solanum bulbocastanum TaxID=147425 RepID=A0AAN8THI3_SOLBU
MARLAHIHIVC